MGWKDRHTGWQQRLGRWTGQARVELTKETSIDSWNRQAGKVSGIVRARNKTGSFKYVIQIVRNRYISLLLQNTFAYSENLNRRFDIIAAKMSKSL
jgi:hypothetical protein